ncbi:MAG: Hpt domain-containing protein [Acidobacteriota bacterium]|nr:Hpt domain-containing protein [Acidobacteriota bacterium]
MQTVDPSLVLDRRQLRDITLDDEELMREVLTALIEDTSRQIELLESAIREQDPERCKRLAHYCKGACANVGANAAAAVLRRMELEALSSDFPHCAQSLAALAEELERLRSAAQTL